MFTTIKMYQHVDSEHEVFLVRKDAQINIPQCHGSLEDHLDIQLDNLSIHIPLEDLKKLLDHTVSINQMKRNLQSFALTNTGKKSQYLMEVNNAHKERCS